jgi:hypothetical protein
VYFLGIIVNPIEEKMIPVRMMAEESGELLREFFRQRR